MLVLPHRQTPDIHRKPERLPHRLATWRPLHSCVVRKSRVYKHSSCISFLSIAGRRFWWERRNPYHREVALRWTRSVLRRYFPLSTDLTPLHLFNP